MPEYLLLVMLTISARHSPVLSLSSLVLPGELTRLPPILCSSP